MSSSNENEQGIVLMEDLEGNTFLELSLRRRAVVKEFKNKLYVDVREYYKDKKSGDSKPGRKGMFLSPQHFQIFCDAGEQIQSALKDGNTAFELEMDPKKFVTISDFRDNFTVDIREFYTKDGNRNPTRKGINLEKTELDMLLKHGQKLLELVKTEETEEDKNTDKNQKKVEEKNQKEVKGTEKQQKQEKEDTEGIEESKQQVKDVQEMEGIEEQKQQEKEAQNNQQLDQEQSKKRALKEEGDDEDDEGGTSQPKRQKVDLMVDVEGNSFVDLSLKRRATVKEFKNKLYVDVREYYKDKNGDSKPGKKGMFLQPQQFQTIFEAGVQIQNALKDRNMAYELELDEKRFVTISDFRNHYTVDIREFYTKDGNRNPTRKGINVDKEELEMLLLHGQDLLKLANANQSE